MLYIFRHIFVDKIKQINLCRTPGTHKNGTRFSDHRAIKFNFAVHVTNIKKGQWKLNTSLLECNQYKRQVSKIITNIGKEGSSIDK